MPKPPVAEKSLNPRKMLQHCQEENVGAPTIGMPSRDAVPPPPTRCQEEATEREKYRESGSRNDKKGAQLGL